MHKCNICAGDAKELFSSKVLKKYNVTYFKCKDCDYIFASNPHWLEEAYSSAINESDIGLVYRNIYFSDILEKVLSLFFKKYEVFLDYGAGYGLFVRLMRDRGYNFLGYDPYCNNIFSKRFQINNLSDLNKIEFISAFEVLEHLEDPKDVFDKIFSKTKTFFFSTELHPGDSPELEKWWYFQPDHGQHISFYNLKTLNYLSLKYNFNLYTDSKSLHILTKEKLPRWLVNQMLNNSNRYFIKAYLFLNSKKKKSLLQEDYIKILNKQ